MKSVSSSITNALNVGSTIETCDNSGAKIVRIIAVKNAKTVKGRKPSCGIGDLVFVSVKKGKPGIRKQVMPGIVVRQRRPYRRRDGTRVQFEDNAIVVLKDEQGNPKGTIFKGPIAKEAAERWPAVAKVARIIV